MSGDSSRQIGKRDFEFIPCGQLDMSIADEDGSKIIVINIAICDHDTPYGFSIRRRYVAEQIARELLAFAAEIWPEGN